MPHATDIDNVPDRPSRDFEQRVESLERARAESERAAIAAFCQELADIKTNYPRFYGADFLLITRSELILMETSPEDMKIFASAEMSPHNDRLQRFLDRFAPDSFQRLCATPTMTIIKGPDAASFARQMNRPDVAARLESATLDKLASTGRPTRASASL